MQETAEASSPVVQQLLQEQVGELLGQKPLDQFCRQYCKQHAGTSVRHATAAAQGLVLLDPSAASEAAGLITSFDVSVGKVKPYCHPGWDLKWQACFQHLLVHCALCTVHGMSLDGPACLAAWDQQHDIIY